MNLSLTSNANFQLKSKSKFLSIHTWKNLELNFNRRSTLQTAFSIWQLTFSTMKSTKKCTVKHAELSIAQKKKMTPKVYAHFVSKTRTRKLSKDKAKRTNRKVLVLMLCSMMKSQLRNHCLTITSNWLSCLLCRLYLLWYQSFQQSNLSPKYR